MKKDFNMTIAAHPSNDLSLSNELQLIKIGLLYADNVKLCSPKSSIILSILSINNMSKVEKLNFIKELAPILGTSGDQIRNIEIFIKLYSDMENKKRLSKQELLVKLKIQKELNNIYKALEGELEKIYMNSKADQLMKAINSNRLDIEVYGTDDMDFDKMLEQFVESIKGTIESSKTYPLFDDGISSLVKSGVREGMFNFRKSLSEKTRHMGFISQIMNRLPDFENATVDEIIDIRKELDRPLMRFRSAIMKTSEDIKYEVWDDDFYYDVEKIFYKEIHPSVLEIEELVQENKYLRTLVTNIISNPLDIATSSGLGLFIGKLSDLPNISAEALAIGAGIANTTYKTWVDYRNNNKK